MGWHARHGAITCCTVSSTWFIDNSSMNVYCKFHVQDIISEWIFDVVSSSWSMHNLATRERPKMVPYETPRNTYEKLKRGNINVDWSIIYYFDSYFWYVFKARSSRQMSVDLSLSFAVECRAKKLYSSRYLHQTRESATMRSTTPHHT